MDSPVFVLTEFQEASEIDAKIDIGEAELFEDTDSSFRDIDSENEVKNLLKFYFNIRWSQLIFLS